MNQSWALIAEPLGVAGLVKLISQHENRVDYINRQRQTMYHLENTFLAKDGRKSLPSVVQKEGNITDF